MQEETLTRITYSEPISIELTRGAKGGYGWEIKLRGSSQDVMLLKLQAIDAKLRDKFPMPAVEAK